MTSLSCDDVGQAGCFAVAVACFWRKDFEKSDLFPVAMMATASLCANKSFLLAALPLSEIVAYLVGLPLGRVMDGTWKNLSMVAVHVLFRMFCAHSQFAFGQFGAIASVAAAIQLMRKPDILKAKLRTVRIASGPLFMFSVIWAFAKQLGVSVTGSIAAAGIIMVLQAAIFMRPDNHALDFVLAVQKLPALFTKRKQKCHGYLMVASLTALSFLLWSDGCWLAFGVTLLSLFMECNRRCTGGIVACPFKCLF